MLSYYIGGKAGLAVGAVLTGVWGSLSGFSYDVGANIFGNWGAELTPILVKRLFTPPKQIQTRNDLQQALQEAFQLAVIDMGSGGCKKGAWKQTHKVPPDTAFLISNIREDKGRKDLADGCCGLLEALHQQGERVFVVDDTPSQATYEALRALQDAPTLFFEVAVVPMLAEHETLLNELRGWGEVYDLARHLQKQLFGRMLAHLGEILKERPRVWQAYNQHFLENIMALQQANLTGMQEALMEIRQLLEGKERLTIQEEVGSTLVRVGEALGKQEETLTEILHRIGKEHQRTREHVSKVGEDVKQHADTKQAETHDKLDEVEGRIIAEVRQGRGKETINIEEALARLAEMPLDKVPAVGNVPQQSRMPYAPNPHFVGREAELKAIAQGLVAEQGAVKIGQVTTVTGIGGIGKTQLAVAFVHRYGQYFAGGVYWLNFGEVGAIGSEVADCGGVVDVPNFSELPEPDRVRLVQEAWQADVPRLLVFDNCDDDEAEALVADWRPKIGGCRVLVTSRRQRWQTAGWQRVAVDTLPLPECVQLLQGLAEQLTEAEAMEIAKALGQFPLALHLAGCFLREYGEVVTVVEYLAEVAKAPLQHASLTGRGAGESPTEHEQHVGQTFAVSWERLREADAMDELARQLMQRAAYFAPEIPIPTDLLWLTMPEAKAVDKLDQTDAMKRLLNLGLLGQTKEGVRVHRLLGAYMLEAVGKGEGQIEVEKALLAEAWRLNGTGYPALLKIWSPHLHHLIDQDEERADENMADLCMALVYHAFQDGNYHMAFPYAQRALAISEQVLGADHPDTATSLNNLAGLYESTGNYAEALPLYERALAIREQVLGADHPSTATSLNNLAMLYQSTGNYAEALPLYERALAISEQVLGADHPSTATGLNNLAMLYKSTGNYAEALPLYERALAILEQVLGADHPDTATSLNNLAGLYESTGNYAEALPLYERALAISEQVLGADHPSTATSLNNLVMLYKSTGNYAEALPLYERALAILEARLGTEHPHTKIVRGNLETLKKQIEEEE